MSFKPNTEQQITLDDNFVNLSPRTQRIIEKSWCRDFADMVFPAINEERFSVLYSDNKFSRPNTPVNYIVGSMILKENGGVSDDEMLESVCCDVRYQYALHSTHLKDQPMSDRTLSRFRERLYNYELETGCNLLEEEMMHLANVFSEYMNLNSSIKRMDSLMVASRSKQMSRLEIIYKVTANALKLIHRLGGEELITSDLRHYLEEEDYNQVIYYCKSEDATPRLENVIKEAEQVKVIMADDQWHEFSEYQLLIRVLNEQSTVDESGDTIPKDKSAIKASSLQNPSDPDATYRSKAGKSNKGYSANIIETVGEDGDSLITGVGYENNLHSDSNYCKEYLEGRPENSESEVMITDGAYGSKKNRELAKTKNVELVSTALSGRETNPFFAGFKFSEDGRKILSCPMGVSPIKTTHYPKTGMCRANFPKSSCEHCPHKEECRAKEQRKNYAIHVSATMAERAKYIQKMSSDKYHALSRMRNAVEGIPSVLRRRYRIDEIPTYGLIRMRHFFDLKVGAYNFNKLVRHNRRLRDKSVKNPVFA